MLRLIPLTLALMLGAGRVTAAQVPEWVTQILAAATLPVIAAEARAEGVSNTDVRAVLEALRTANVPAHEARDVLDEARKAHREHGPVDNFGAFVQAQLQAGKRGRDLAAAIRAEHAARGKGKPAAGRADDPQGAKGQSGTKGRPDAPGAAADAKKAAGQKGRPANPQDAKRPDGKGRPPTR